MNLYGNKSEGTACYHHVGILELAAGNKEEVLANLNSHPPRNGDGLEDRGNQARIFLIRLDSRPAKRRNRFRQIETNAGGR